ncbi:PAS domain S-box-containing protein [Pontibacter ummariensis]|uniref:histidine kinase n=1 Tax=Pontibacter ummariensis TaxID=1610492 RepID=A0A239J6C1_9BACT|nr:PAS domain S-box protein [Pontibacter ummariensis]PRY08895.1 PAS domain S-box-containing protein [Pontibacter ummariensis]SNT01212.1 PAS domain S-box-containing protein [Pontibacter ummariensis]
MPYIPSRQADAQNTEQATALLQVLVQLAKPAHGVVVALPNGQVLAANAQALIYKSQDTEPGNALHLRDLLRIPQDKFPEVMEELQQQRKLTGEVPLSENAQCQPYNYSCRMVHFGDEVFVCVELANVGQPTALLPYDGDSYHHVFDGSSEPMFLLDCEGNIIDINQSATELIQQEKDELVGKSILRSFQLNLFERVALKRQLQQAQVGGKQKFEWWLHDSNQELLPVEVTLQKGTFKNNQVLYGSIKNLNEVIGTEQDIRFRNHQLEFVNQLITNLSASNGQYEVLQYTLNELLEKSDVTGGCVYSYSSAEGRASLSYSVGEEGNNQLPEELNIIPELAERLLGPDKRKAQYYLQEQLQSTLHRKLTLVPIATEKELIALILVWPSNDINITQSFVGLLGFIGTAIGNYISRHKLQQQLIHTEDKYRALFESSYDAIILFKDGKVVDCNDKTLEFFRCTREDLIGFTPNEYSPEYQPDGERSEEKAARIMREVLATGKSATFEWKNRRKDGTLFDVELNVNRLILDGEYYLQVFKRDITQRKQAQQARQREEVLQASMDQFRNFLDKVNLIYYSLDTRGNIAYTNDYFLKYVEYTREELIGQNFYELLVPEQDRAQRWQDFQNSLEKKHLSSYYERDIRTKSGQLKTIRWNCMFEYDSEGHVTGITSVGKDMTDKRIAMEALKDNKIRLQDLFDNAHDLIQNISVDNKFIFVNKAWKDRLGYTDQDIEALTLNDIVHPYYKAKLIYQLRNLYKGENVNKIETVFLTKAGKPVHLIGSITCSWQDSKPVATRAILHDITDRIKAERLQKVYYSIANLAISSKDLNSLYSAIHRELSKIIETRNIYIALCDNEHRYLNFVYLVDQFIDKSSKAQIQRPFSVGLSEYIIETGKPLYMQKQELQTLSEKEGFTVFGALPEVILCSPLAIGDRIIGVITLQDYQNADAYVHTDIEILHFISNQVALAIERKRNEEQINTQNARLNAIFESGTHHMWSLNRNYELTSFNRNFASSFEARSGHPLQLHMPLDDTAIVAVHENSYTFWEDKYKLAFSGKPQHFEIYLQSKDTWREVYLNPIYLNDGSFEEISGIALDITDKKKSQLALAENEEKFRHIFESFQDVYYRCAMDGTIELVSPSIYQLFGYTEGEVLGLKAAQFYSSPEVQMDVRERLLKEYSLRDMEVEMISKDGSTRTVLLDSKLVFNELGKPIAMEGVVRDVSELKRTQMALLKSKEEAENLLKVKDQFLANMSHELRTPMNGIIGMIDLLSQVNVDPEQRDYIDTLRKSSDALLAILNDILDLSKMQAGKLVLHESGVDLHETLDKIYSLFVNRAQQKDLALSYSIAPGTPRHIITDETRLLQILSNLTSNAIKFTNAGEIKVSVHAEPLAKQYYRLHVRVKDTGIGISPEDQQLLFNDFTQLDNSSTKTFGGTGLGLAISRQLSHLLGGDIGVESRDGDGSTFWFNIKVRLANATEVEEQQQRQQHQKAEPKALDNNPYVLLVDDNQINQKVAQKLLERLGCRIDVASNGYEAIELAVANKYQVIFMDIQMPEMDGVTATLQIKEKLGSSCPPVVAMTAYSMKDDAEKFMSQGMDDYISKPVKSADLHAMITKWEQMTQPAEQAAGSEQAPTEEAAATPIVDLQVVAQLKQIGGEDFAKQLYAEFEEEAGELLEEAKKELQAQHYKGILSTLHQLKGTGFTLGINPLAELAKQLEQDIKQDHLEHIDENFSKLQTHYENYRKSYKDIIFS